ncbi:O-methyltransferase-domain-containing protein [Mycena alexandri]|uniref:O-methyltransferase-domain-containing protein n=1 Tax=Mycena alexandri TaxID=1745969 RepID=A0AAD6SYA2_9AGAR|nr:O-methyltransferase-domain-containing protein [Mycena alexandri]
MTSGKAQVETLLALINQATHQAVAEYDKAGADVPSLDSVEPHPLDGSNDTSTLKKAIRLLEGACEQLCATLAPPHHTIINRTQNCDWPCFATVIEARVADALAGHPAGLHVAELSKVVNIEPKKLARILRVLATKHCFTEVDGDVFANNRLSLMLHSANPVSDLASMQLTLLPKVTTALWDTLSQEPHATSNERTDAPLMRALQYDGDFFDWMKAHPEKRSSFQRAMVGMNTVMGSKNVLYQYNWDNCKTLCDVGSGVGSFSMPLSRLYPHIHISMIDLPGPIGQAKQFWTREYPEAIVEGRVKLVEGDFFKPITVKDQDIYYIGNCVHNWADGDARLILKNIREAMGKNSRLLIHDYVIQHLNRTQVTDAPTSLSLQLDAAPAPLLANFGMGSVRAHYQDITMLITYNARERSLNEVSDLAANGDLVLDGVLDLGETTLLQFRAAQ